MAELSPYIRYFGDKVRGKQFIRPGLQELARTISIAEDAGYSSYQRRVVLDQDTNTYALLRVDVGVHALNIYSGFDVPPPPEPEEPIPEEIREKELKKAVALWSGMAHLHFILDDPGGDPERPNEDYPFMKEFKPTKATFKDYPKDFPEGLNYQDVERLAVTLDSGLKAGGQDELGPSERPPGHPSDRTSQTDMIRPCRFTGLLAEAVAVTMGYGTFGTDGDTRVALLPPGTDPDYKNSVRTEGFQPLYDWRYERSHGIGKDIKGDLWLIECSYLNGIIARPLPMLVTNIVSIKSLDKEGAKVIRKLGGYPSGESFPSSRGYITDLIEDEEIVELLSPEDYRLFCGDDQSGNERFIYFDYISWAFSDESNEARLCNYDTEDSYGYFKNHYLKMTFTINPGTGSQPPSGSATITEIDSGYMTYSNQSTGRGQTGIYYYDTDNRQYQPMGIYKPAGYSVYPGSGNVDQVIWVTWMEDHWSEVHYVANITHPKTTKYNYRCSPSDFRAGSGRFDYNMNVPGAGPGIWAYIDANYTTEIPSSGGTINSTEGDYMQLTGGSGEILTEWFGNATMFWNVYCEGTYDRVSKPYPVKATNILIHPYARAGYFCIRVDLREPTVASHCIQRFRYKSYPEIWAGANWQSPGSYPPGLPFSPPPPSEGFPWGGTGWTATSDAVSYIVGGYDTSEQLNFGNCEDSPDVPAWINGYFGWELKPEGSNELAQSISWAASSGLCTPANEGGSGDDATEIPYTQTGGYWKRTTTTLNPGLTSFDSWLVCPGIKGHIKQFPRYSKSGWNIAEGITYYRDHFFQYSTTGPRAVIYTNPTKTINPADVYEYHLVVEAEGTWPGMPSGGDDSTHRTLSFVGINGP